VQKRRASIDMIFWTGAFTTWQFTAVRYAASRRTMRTLLTSGSGFLGRTRARPLRERRDDAVIVSRGNNGDATRDGIDALGPAAAAFGVRVARQQVEPSDDPLARICVAWEAAR
jgi:hypothetical protein